MKQTFYTHMPGFEKLTSAAVNTRWPLVCLGAKPSFSSREERLRPENKRQTKRVTFPFFHKFFRGKMGKAALQEIMPKHMPHFIMV